MMQIDLQKFCSDLDWRTDINRPFFRDGFTWATDAKILIRVDGCHAEQRENGIDVDGVLPKGIEDITFSPFPHVEVGPEPVAKPNSCDACQATGKVIGDDCKSCRGRGTVECITCCHKNDCEDCAGTGVVDRPSTTDDAPSKLRGCEGCGGTGELYDPSFPYPVYIEIEQYWLERKYVVLLQSLPGLQIDLSQPLSKLSGLAFKFDGGYGRVYYRYGEQKGGK